MNKKVLYENASKLKELKDIQKLETEYDNWKNAVLQYAADHKLEVEQYRVMLHVVNVPFESKEETLRKYYSCIEKVINYMRMEDIRNSYMKGTLENLICNFGLYLQTMFFTEPSKHMSFQKADLDKIVINNEYDIQHILYAVVKSAYPTARREVYQDIGYAADRSDIRIDEIDTIIELKCTRKGVSEKDLFRQLGEDAFFYKCSNLIIYVYDKENVIKDVTNFIRALQRNEEEAGKEIRVYVEQAKNLL